MEFFQKFIRFDGRTLPLADCPDKKGISKNQKSIKTVTVTGPLSLTNVSGAAAKAGDALEKAVNRKLRDTAEDCRREGLVFLPFAVETLGGLHKGAVTQVKLLASALARCKGLEEGEVTGQLFGRLSLTLMRANALMLSSRCQDADFPLPQVDGIQ